MKTKPIRNGCTMIGRRRRGSNAIQFLTLLLEVNGQRWSPPATRASFDRTVDAAVKVRQGAYEGSRQAGDGEDVPAL